MATTSTNAFMTYPGQGKESTREDLSGILYDISPLDCVVTTKIGKDTCDNTLVEWLQDELGAPNGANAHLEAEVIEYQAITPQVRLSNTCQIMQRTASVSGTQEVTDHATYKSQVSYTMSRRLSELKRDHETIILSNQSRDLGSTTTPRKMGSMLAYITSNVNKGTGTAADPSAPGVARVDGTLRNLSEALFMDSAQKLWTKTSDGGDVILCPPNLRNTVSRFTGNAQRTVEASDSQIWSGISVISTDWGVFKIITSRYMRNPGRELMILNFDFWAMSVLRPVAKREMPSNADASQWLLLQESTLRAKHEGANALVADVQPAP